MSSKRKNESIKREEHSAEDAESQKGKRMKIRQTLAICDELVKLLSLATAEDNVTNKNRISIIGKLLLLFEHAKEAIDEIITKFTSCSLIELVVQFLTNIKSPNGDDACLIERLLKLINNAIASTDDVNGTFSRLMGNTDVDALMSLLVAYIRGVVNASTAATVAQKGQVREIPFQALWIMLNLCMSTTEIYVQTALDIGAVEAVWKHLMSDAVHLSMGTERLNHAVNLLSIFAATSRIVQEDICQILDVVKYIFRISPERKSANSSAATENEWKIASCNIIVNLHEHYKNDFFLERVIYNGLAVLILRSMAQCEIDDQLTYDFMRVMSCFSTTMSCYFLHDLAFVAGLVFEIRFMPTSPTVSQLLILGEVCSCIASLWKNSYILANPGVALTAAEVQAEGKLGDGTDSAGNTRIGADEQGCESSEGGNDDAYENSTDKLLPNVSTVNEDNSAHMDGILVATIAEGNGMNPNGSTFANDNVNNKDIRAADDEMAKKHADGTEDIRTLFGMMNEDTDNKDGCTRTDDVGSGETFEGSEAGGTATVHNANYTANLRFKIYFELENMLLTTLISLPFAVVEDTSRYAAFNMLADILIYTCVRTELEGLISNGFLGKMVEMFLLILTHYRALYGGPNILKRWLESFAAIVVKLYVAKEIELLQRMRTVLYDGRMSSEAMEEQMLTYEFDADIRAAIVTYNTYMKKVFA